MTNLQRIRRSRGLTQSQLAQRSGVNIKMVQKYEQGVKEINNAHALTVLKLARALQCEIEAILNYK